MKKIDSRCLSMLIKDAKNIVFFGGAGVSTESGIKDYRSKDGLYQNKFHGFTPEIILSDTFFNNNAALFFEYYKETFLTKKVRPNYTHYFLVYLEKIGKLKAVITQNIDNLHNEAGSKNIIELHGNITRNYTLKTRKLIKGTEVILNQNGVPYYQGEIIKPDVVLYGEQLNLITLKNAINQIKNADLLIVGGTSLRVFPASGLITYFNGPYLVGINKESIDVPLFIEGSISQTFKEVAKILNYNVEENDEY